MRFRVAPGLRPVLVLSALTLALACGGGGSSRPSKPTGNGLAQLRARMQAQPADQRASSMDQLWQIRDHDRKEVYEFKEGDRTIRFVTTQVAEPTKERLDTLSLVITKHDVEQNRIDFALDRTNPKQMSLVVDGDAYPVTKAGEVPRFARPGAKGDLFTAEGEGETIQASWSLDLVGAQRHLTIKLTSPGSGFLVQIAYLLNAQDQAETCELAACPGAGLPTERAVLRRVERTITPAKDFSVSTQPLRDLLERPARALPVVDLEGSFRLGRTEDVAIEGVRHLAYQQSLIVKMPHQQNLEWTETLYQHPDSKGPMLWHMAAYHFHPFLNLASTGQVGPLQLPDLIKPGEQGVALEIPVKEGMVRKTWRVDAADSCAARLVMTTTGPDGKKLSEVTYDLDRQGGLKGGSVFCHLEDGKEQQDLFTRF